MASFDIPPDIPLLDTAQMIEVDRAVVEDYRIWLIQMMEIAGANLAALARERFLAGDPREKSVVVLSGTGGNGGDALVTARRLHNWGAKISLGLSKPAPDMAPVTWHQLDILRRLGIEGAEAPQPPGALPQTPALIIDGLIGYSLKGAPHGTVADLVRWANKSSAPILSFDVPTGLEATSGRIFDPTIEAAATMTLALPKTGIVSDAAAKVVGELYLADIGIPPELYAHPGLDVDVGPIFAREEIVRLR